MYRLAQIEDKDLLTPRYSSRYVDLYYKPSSAGVGRLEFPPAGVCAEMDEIPCIMARRSSLPEKTRDKR